MIILIACWHIPLNILGPKMQLFQSENTSFVSFSPPGIACDEAAVTSNIQILLKLQVSESNHDLLKTHLLITYFKSVKFRCGQRCGAGRPSSPSASTRKLKQWVVPTIRQQWDGQKNGLENESGEQSAG